MKKTRGIILALLLLIGSISLYYSLEVFKGRKATLDIVNIFINSDAYRIKNNQFSKKQMEALLKVEDPNFYSHSGIDLTTKGGGLKTLTQNLAKKFYFKDFSSGVPLIKELLLAKFAVNPLVSKELQLDIYINIVYFGNNIYGFPDAANFYFEKDFSQLTQEEYLALVASLVDPENFNPLDYPVRNKDRVAKIKEYLKGNYVPKSLMDIYYDKK